MEKVREDFRFRIVSSELQKLEAIAEMESEGFRWVSSSKIIHFVGKSGRVYHRKKYQMRFQRMEK